MLAAIDTGLRTTAVSENGGNTDLAPTTVFQWLRIAFFREKRT